MVIARANDACVEGFSSISRIRFLYSDVSEISRKLCELRDYSLLSSSCLAQMLAGAALLGMGLAESDDMIVLDTESDGLLGGCHLEMTGHGCMRGYVQNRMLQSINAKNSMDRNDRDLTLKDIWGSHGKVRFSRTDTTDKIVSQIFFEMSKCHSENIFEDFFGAGFKMPACVNIVATTLNNEIDRARALAMLGMPDSNTKDFMRLKQLFNDGTVAEQLEYDASLSTMREVFDMPDILTGPTRTLQFGCSCSRQRSEDAIASLPKAELAGLSNSGSGKTFQCHLCGKTYFIPPELIDHFAKQ